MKFKYAECSVDKNLIAAWVLQLDDKNINFRYVASNIESLFFKK